MEKEKKLEELFPSLHVEDSLDGPLSNDCCFVFGTDSNAKQIHVHKLFLAAASPVFQAMFYGEMPKESTIKIDDIQPETFRILLDSIYSSSATLPKTHLELQDLYYAAHKYMMSHIKENCEKKLIETLSSFDAIKAYEFAKLFSIPTLLVRARRMIVFNSTCTTIETEVIEEAQLSTLLMILDTEDLNFPREHLLFDAVIRWGRKECERKGQPVDNKHIRANVDQALKKIHFLAMDQKEFSEYVADCPVLTEAERLSILIKISNPSKNTPMPSGFSTNDFPRMVMPFTNSNLDKEEAALKMLENQRSLKNKGNNRPQNLIDILAYLCDTKDFADCSFIIIEGGEVTKFTAHKLILSILCPVLHEMILEKPQDDDPIKIEHVKPAIFELVLNFIYKPSCKIPPDFEVIEQLVVAANKFRLPSLIVECTSKLESMLQPHNALKVYDVVKHLNLQPSHNNKSFESITLIISKRAEQVLNSPDFEDIHLITLLSILEFQEKLSSKKATLFAATIRWGFKECERMSLSVDAENLRYVIDPVLKKINFLAFSPQEFVEGPAVCEIFTDSECLSILMNIMNPSAEFAMPEGFSTKIEKKKN